MSSAQRKKPSRKNSGQLERVRVFSELIHRLGPRNVGARIATGAFDGGNVLFDALSPERMVVAVGAIGGGGHALQRGVDYAVAREIFKGPIGAYQGLQHPMEEAKALLEAASLMIQKAAWLQDSGEHSKVVGDCANMSKMVGTDAALQYFGGYGFTESNYMLSHFNSARLCKVAPINREMTLNYIGEYILGLPKS